MGTMKIMRELEDKIRAEGCQVLEVTTRRRNPHIFYTVQYGEHQPKTLSMGCSPGTSAERRFLADLRHYKRFGP